MHFIWNVNRNNTCRRCQLKRPVLFEFEESKKQMSIPNCDTEEIPDNLLDMLGDHLKRIDSNIRLMIDYGARRSSSSKSQRGGAIHILQRLSGQWGQFVDVIHLVEIGNGDHLKAVPFPRTVAEPSNSCINIPSLQ